MSKPKTANQLIILEKEVVADEKFYTKRARQDFIRQKEENYEDMMEALKDVGGYWVRTAERLGTVLAGDRECTFKELTAAINLLEKVQANLGVFLNLPTTEAGVNKQRDIEFKDKELALKLGTLIQKYLKEAGLAVDVDTDVLHDVVIQAGNEILDAAGQSVSKSKSEGEPNVDSNSSEDEENSSSENIPDK